MNERGPARVQTREKRAAAPPAIRRTSREPAVQVEHRPAPAVAPAPVPYARLSLAEKQAVHRDRMREPPVTCQRCEVQFTPADLAKHECRGPREPHPLGRWLTWKEVTRAPYRIPRGTVSHWVATGRVRTERRGLHRVYLERDVARELARQKAEAAAGSTDGTGSTDRTEAPR